MQISEDLCKSQVCLMKDVYIVMIFQKRNDALILNVTFHDHNVTLGR